MSAPTPAQLIAVRRRVRGVTGATDVDTLPDDAITDAWENEGAGTILLTAATICDWMANGAAEHFKWSADGSSIDLTVKGPQYRAAATELRRAYQYSRGGTITVIRSEDEDNDDTEYSA